MKVPADRRGVFRRKSLGIGGGGGEVESLPLGVATLRKDGDAAVHVPANQHLRMVGGVGEACG